MQVLAQILEDIAALTDAIRRAEAATEWDYPRIDSLYSTRGAKIREALKAGVVPSYLSMVTGLGATS
jgi:hypothetical protein